MSEQKSSTGTRALQVILGIAALSLAFIILFYPGFGLATLIILLSFGLLIGGFMLFGESLVSRTQSGAIRAIGVIIGLIIVAFSVAVLVYPGLGTATLIIILSFEVIIVGCGLIFQTLSGEHSGWVKGLLVVLGIVVIGFGLAAIVYPGLAAATLVILLSIGLLMIGTMGIAKGLIGE